MTNAVKTIHKGRAVSATLLRGLSVGAASILVTTGLMLTFAPPVSASTTVPAGAVVVSNHTEAIASPVARVPRTQRFRLA